MAFKIIETYAAASNYHLFQSLQSGTPFKGFISYLSIRISQTAKLMGFKKAIHEMMFEDNLSVNISKRYAGKPCKRYVLYRMVLG